MTCGKFSTGDRVQIRNDWLPDNLRSKSAVIVGFQKNSGCMFARIRWSKSIYTNEVGSLFPLDELRKV
jgi:hypothetical protein